MVISGTPEPLKSPTPDKQEQRDSAHQMQSVSLRRNFKKQCWIQMKVCRQKPCPWTQTELHERLVSDRRDAEQRGHLKIKKKIDSRENL